MSKHLRVLGFASVLLGILAFGLYWFRMPVMIELLRMADMPALEDRDAIELGRNEAWADEYFTVEEIDDRTFAISEARYFRDVYMYLLVGEERALLIDSGSPIRDPSEVVSQLTDLPVAVIGTHLHFDHIGNHDKFEHVLMQDTPEIRARVKDGTFAVAEHEYQGSIEGFETISWTVNEWWKPGVVLDLGNRELELIETPGHTPDSVSIWDVHGGSLFMGDYAGDGEIYAFLPNSSLQAYLDTTQGLLGRLPEDARIYAAHGAADFAGAPVTDRRSLSDLTRALLRMREGTVSATGLFPRSYRVNRNTVILTDLKAPNSSVWDFRR